jgi:hypothetical protein
VPKKEFPAMQRVLRLILVVLLSSLTACHIEPITTSRTSEASAQSTAEKKPQELSSNKLEGHYEGTVLNFHQDYGGSHSVAIDFEATGTCLYSDPIGNKQPCHWERSTDRITVRVTDGETLPFHLADDNLTYLKRDGAGGGVCIQLAKNRAVSDPEAGFCQGAMLGLPPPPR